MLLLYLRLCFRKKCSHKGESLRAVLEAGIVTFTTLSGKEIFAETAVLHSLL
jgi:hypothetical protein